jgi:hypothetical protein
VRQGPTSHLPLHDNDDRQTDRQTDTENINTKIETAISTKQNLLEAGDNITIIGNRISSTGAGGITSSSNV